MRYLQITDEQLFCTHIILSLFLAHNPTTEFQLFHVKHRQLQAFNQALTNIVQIVSRETNYRTNLQL